MKNKQRIKSIDLLRGLVIVIMALDHVRDYFHYDAFFFDPSDVSQTNLALFGTRFITHFCAPVFVFLAGTSSFFVGQRKSKKELSSWLLKRGVWLLFVELVIIKLAWMFKLDFTAIDLMVIWVLGISMIFLAGFIYVPKKILIPLCVIAIFGHNYLDNYQPTIPQLSIMWNFLHVSSPNDFGSFQVYSFYPLIPWIFVMPLGYYFGELYLPKVTSEIRTKRLFQIGISITLLFFIIRFINVYGEPQVWIHHKSFSKNLMSFFNVSKYPPSLLYLLITLGPSVIFLKFAEKWSNTFFVTIGRVPMFFYIIHIYVIHAFAVLAAMLTGFKASDMIIDVWVTEEPQLQGYGFDLWVVYVIWVVLLIGLYPICKWYDNYKRNNRDKWWLTYL
ncbi:MAG: putative membrane protein [Arcticibacterium sp.]|jgi:uncharacterized membrane protein